MRYSNALAVVAPLCWVTLANCSLSAIPASRTIVVRGIVATPRIVAWQTGTFSGDEPKNCVRSPARLPPSVAPKSGATLIVQADDIVYVELVEAEKYLSWRPGTKPPPRVFPWSAARSSDPSVLAHVALCPSREVSTLPVVVYAFRALRSGTATLTAPITPAWKRVKSERYHGLHPYRSTVIVGLP
jgi:hypothetical protein